MAKSKSKKTTKGGKRPQQARATGGKRAGSRRSRRSSAATMIFSRQNYMLLLLGVLAIVIGYTTMRIENEVDGFISLYVAPLLILGGYLEIIYAILWRPKQKPQEAEAS